ncbi:MAG: NERD domain-containing protein [Victivallales bacterium]|nr:NERD domain-containing protein [Victivallales bacterium]
MAIFIPSTCDTMRRPDSEIEVFDDIAKYLSNDWYVFHSFDYLARDLSGRLWDGEIDFLLYNERKGFLVIEVKGGTISYINSEWFQNGEHIDPVEQAKKNKYAVMRLLKEKLGREVPLRFAHAVCFPSLENNATVWPPEAEGIVILNKDLKNIEALANRLVEEAPLPPGIQGRVSVDEVLDILSPEFEYAPRLKKQITEEERSFFLMSQQQCHVLNMLRNYPRLLIQGGAGTGKTVLAMKKAEMVAAEGGNALLLCFNELLAQRIRSTMKNWRSLHVSAFFQFCIDLMKIPQADYNKYKDNPLLYSKILPELLEKHLDQHHITYDAVIVDEAQDFTPKIWKAVEKLVAPNGHFYVFYDPDQNIFQDTLNVPDFGIPPLVLTENCRNTRKILDALEPYKTVEMFPSEMTPYGSDVIVLQGDCRELLGKELKRLCQDEQLRQSDIVVLGAHSLHHTVLGGDNKCGEYTLVEQPQKSAAKQIAYYTYMKFKGCEANVIILLDFDENDPRWDSHGTYTAMSRASHLLIILKR